MTLALTLCLFCLGEATLTTYPTHVYKVADAGNLPLESWFFYLIVTGGEQAALVAESLEMELLRGDVTVATETLEGGSFPALLQRTFGIASDTPALDVRRQMHIDERFDIPIVASRPKALQIDRIRARLVVRGTDGTATELEQEIPLETYRRRTRLLFPLRGPAMVSQGPFHNRGHYGPSNQFAIDVLALTEDYAPMTDADDQENSGYAGWLHDVFAPAAGTVVYARNDVPDNPRPGATLDKVVCSRLPDPILTVPGSHVVIDHGNGEYSVLMHLHLGSVLVKKGDPVVQGQKIGELGSSGDSFGPHLHYQLQAGPEVFASDPLPMSFANVNQPLVRGAFFSAR